MRWGLSILVAGALSLAAAAADQPRNLPVPCMDASAGAPSCNVSKKDRKEAQAAFARGLKLQKANRMEEAFAEFEAAAQLAPRDLDYVTAREMTRQQLVFDHLERGNAHSLQGQQVEALAEFRTALHLDPENEFARQRLSDALREWAPTTPAPARVLAAAGEIQLTPQPGQHDFHYRGDSRGLLSQVAAAYGIVATLDDSVVTRRVRFDIENVDFPTAIRAACRVTRSFWTPLEPKQILLAADSIENHRLFDRMAMRTFYVPGVASAQELTELVNVVRAMFDLRFLNQQPQTSTLVVRAPERVLDGVTEFLESLGDTRPEVMLDVHVYEISHTLVRNMGLNIPNQFRLFNIPASALTALGGQNIQDLINQLISSGGINQANTQAISALLAQLQNQQNSIFSQPVATFGSGLTFFGVSLGTLGGQLSFNESTAKTLQHAMLRASQGKDATFRVGSRFPILNASFAPIFNTPAISQVIQNNSFQAPFPSFNYEDVGLSLKAKPRVHGNSDVSLELEMQVRSVQAASLNGVPVISNREYKGSITVKDGEPAVVAGSVSRSEQRSMSGLPGLGAVPGLNRVMTSNNKEEDENELLIVITPHVISGGKTSAGAEIWMTQ